MAMALAYGRVDRSAYTDEDRQLGALIDDARNNLDAEMSILRPRMWTYLNWYSPPFNTDIARHDAWEESIDNNDEAALTRDNFPICRAVVDIWTSLEAGTPPSPRAEPERVSPPPTVFDQQLALALRQVYAQQRTMESKKADIRSARMRRFLRHDDFPLKHWQAVRRKNLYGSSWMKVMPHPRKKGPHTTIARNPTSMYAYYSSRDPDDLESLLSAQQMSARRASARWGLGLEFYDDGSVRIPRGYDDGRYRDVNDQWFTQDRTMVWVEDYWYVERQYDNQGFITDHHVVNCVRVCDRIVERYRMPWMYLPWIQWSNTDERDSYGWSDIAGVLDINDEINRRISQQGDVISMASSPRFQLLGSTAARDVEMPAPFEMISLQDTEQIQQILARIDVFPTQIHFDFLMDLLHRVSGLPPIVWGLINNAQTSGRALSASWKATEARLTPKLMQNNKSLNLWTDIVVDYAREYNWQGGREIFTDNEREAYDDFRWIFPPMEPRDFTEVTMDAITRRDAGLTTTVKAMRDTGDEAAEETWEEVKAENNDIDAHPDKVTAKLMAAQAQMNNIGLAQQLGLTPGAPQQSIVAPTAAAPPPPAAAAPPQAAAPPGMEGALPPTQPGAVANAGQPVPGTPNPIEAGTLVRNGEVSQQLLQQGPI